MLEVGIQPLFRIQFGTVARQVEEFDLVLALSHPCLDRFAVMHPEVVKNQEHLFAGVLEQCCQELNVSLPELKASSMIIQRVLP